MMMLELWKLHSLLWSSDHEPGMAHFRTQYADYVV